MTATGWPLFDSRAETSSALEAPSRSSRGSRIPAGSSPPEPEVSALALADSATSENWRVPGSGRASPLGWAGGCPYGKLPPRTVVGASGSLNAWKSAQTLFPGPGPNRCRAASRASAAPSSPPPPLPKIPATSEAIAITSVTFHSWPGRQMLWEGSITPYSPGSFAVLMGGPQASSMNLLTPAT